MHFQLKLCLNILESSFQTMHKVVNATPGCYNSQISRKMNKNKQKNKQNKETTSAFPTESIKQIKELIKNSKYNKGRLDCSCKNKRWRQGISDAGDRSRCCFHVERRNLWTDRDGRRKEGKSNDRELISSSRWGEEAEERVPKGSLKNMEMKRKGVERPIKTARGWSLMACVAVCVRGHIFPMRLRKIRLMSAQTESLAPLSAAVHFKSRITRVRFKLLNSVQTFLYWKLWDIC